MLSWLRAIFSSDSETNKMDHRETDHLWRVMSKMDPWLARERFVRLKLSKEQKLEVEGILTGTRKPSEFADVKNWAAEHNVDPDGVDATLHAVQTIMKGRRIHYLFELGNDAPRARFPFFVDDDSPTILFDDREGHLRIASLAEFISDNSIGRYTLEPHDLGSLCQRITGDGRQQRRSSIAARITLERMVNDDGLLADPVDVEPIVAALIEKGVQVSSSDVTFESPIRKLGLHTVLIHADSDEEAEVYVWVVPAVT